MCKSCRAISFFKGDVEEHARSTGHAEFNELDENMLVVADLLLGEGDDALK